MFSITGVIFKKPLLWFEDLSDLRQLEGLFRSYTLLARIVGRNHPQFADHCLMAYAMVMQMWKVSQNHIIIHLVYFLYVIFIYGIYLLYLMSLFI